MRPGKTIRLTGLTPEIAAASGRVARSVGVGGRGGRRIFLLSPANAAGVRAKMILREAATFPLAVRLREQGLPLGEIFSFISGLYFRGKLAYARAHAAPPGGVPGIVVITASGGLISPDRLFRLPDLLEITSGDIASGEPAYRVPLERDARLLCEHIGAECEVVLLGSVATPKYVDPLLEIFGKRLLFPQEFVGRGDMSRGGLMLRYASELKELTYVPVAGAVRHGTRPPKLPKVARLSVEPPRERNRHSSTERKRTAARNELASGEITWTRRRESPEAPMEAVILAGIQGSGKSTFYKERFSEAFARINLDELKTRARELEVFAECLREKRSFVVDNTNTKAADRARYIGPARAAGYRVTGYFLESSLKDAIRRNGQRSGKAKVPVPAIAAALRRLELMRKEEGFDQIFRVKNSNGGKFEVEETQ